MTEENLLYLMLGPFANSRWAVVDVESQIYSKERGFVWIRKDRQLDEVTPGKYTEVEGK